MPQVQNKPRIHTATVPLLRPAMSWSKSNLVIERRISGQFMLEKPLPAPRVSLLSSAPLTQAQIELGKKIAAKHGLTE